MNSNDYQANVKHLENVSGKTYPRLMDGLSLHQVRLLHGALGIAGEGGEVADLVKKHIFCGTPLDKIDFIGEVGDTLWYIPVALDAIGATMEEAMAANVAKLRFRHSLPSGRDKAGERRAMTQAIQQLRRDA